MIICECVSGRQVVACFKCAGRQLGLARRTRLSAAPHSAPEEGRRFAREGVPIGCGSKIAIHTPLLSQTLADAAVELGCRVELGEFDDLDEMQIGDLQALSQCLSQWALRAQIIEQSDSRALLFEPGNGTSRSTTTRVV